MSPTTKSADEGGEKAVHPYKIQPTKAFWRQTVSNSHPLDIGEWYRKKFEIGTRQVATAGSCFAQHIGRALRENNFRYVDAEPAPVFLRPEDRTKFGYEMYSARYGNIYTTRQLLQLFDRAFGNFNSVETYWEKDGGVVDPFRPTIEPEPFGSVAELEHSRRSHLECVRRVFETAQIFVFTFGLTEAWQNNADGSIVPLAPGTAGGHYDPDRYSLLNLDHTENFNDFIAFYKKVVKIKPGMKFLLTVSPVPLAATATQDNVVVATSYSKSVLRSVAGLFAKKFENVDYFPSYEIISSHVMRSQFFEPDMRNVSPHGVEHVMRHFFSEHPPKNATHVLQDKEKERNPDDVICDEELLAAFGDQL